MNFSTRQPAALSPARRIRGFARWHPLAGPIIWISTLQYFLLQVLVAAAWNPGYDWRLNSISDLAATSCGEFDGRAVCSPLAGLMNASFVLLGIAMAAGALLEYQQFRRSATGFGLIAIAGVGAILVGFFPENTTYWAHLVGADLAFLVGNIALIVLGFALDIPGWLRWYSVVSGVVALFALVLFLSHHRFFLELGGMERVAAYPQTIWLTVFGFWMTMRSSRERPVARWSGDQTMGM